MRIGDLEHLTSASETTQLSVEGSAALAISGFSSFALGRSSLVSTSVRNQAVNSGRFRSAFSSVSVTSVASGPGAIAISSASSYSEVSP